MLDAAHPIARLLKEDPRYSFEAYVLVFESLNYAHKVLGLGMERPPAEETEEEDESDESSESGEKSGAERHLTGQQLCEAVRQYALDQYGYMAQCVLKSWGITATSDFGEIVFNLIRIGQMRKTADDRREHFDNLFDFDEAFRENFKITLPETT